MTKAHHRGRTYRMFLNEQLAVTIQLMDGTSLDATIKSFDWFAVVVARAGCDQLIFKHAIGLIRPTDALRQATTTT